MTIDFEQARAIAVTEARKVLLRLAGDRTDYLRSDYVEGHVCWIFFRASDIGVPRDDWLEGDWAYGISRWGDVRFVYDLSDDPVRMQKYVELLSDFFVRDRAREADRVRREQ